MSLFGFFLGFSVWLMFQTFSYDYERGLFLVGAHVYSDFAATLPLIRSFSFGDNWPVEYPHYSGEPIHYHFLFFLLVGWLEKIGLPIHWALNLPSALGFFAILATLYVLAKRLFNDARIALLSVMFFLFNGSLSFWEYFKTHLLSLSTLNDISAITKFTAMGPWDGGPVLAFWNLNVYINQRHFCLALGFLLIFILSCLLLENRSKKVHVNTALFFGIIIGLFPLIHKPVMLMFAVVMSVYFIAFPYLRKFLFLVGAVSLVEMAILWLLSFTLGAGASEAIGWYPGFAIHDAKSFGEILTFFWYQFGLHCILIPIGVCLAPKRARLFILPALIVFVIAFSFRFSTDVLANHKFINFFLVVAQMLSAYVVMRGYDLMTRVFDKFHKPIRQTGNSLIKVMLAAVVLPLTLSGIIDFFPIVNAHMYEIQGSESSPEARWLHENTPKDAVVLNGLYLYDPASIVGRKIFLGYGYFVVTAGYDFWGRLEIFKKIVSSNDQKIFCPLLRENHIGYVISQDNRGDPDLPPTNHAYFTQNYTPSFVSPNRKISIFSTEILCS